MEDTIALELHVLERMLRDCVAVGLLPLPHYVASCAAPEFVVRRCYYLLCGESPTC